MAFFFFGTLMDHDVLERVLDRPVQDGELARARLPGYRRVTAAERPYPMLVPDPAGEVWGVLLARPTRRDAIRIRHFEDEEYLDREVTVWRPDGARVAARAFFALATMGRTEQPWDFERWAREQKSAFLDMCGAWMRDCPE